MEIRYSKNGVDLGKAFTLRSEFKNSAFHPSVVIKVSSLHVSLIMYLFKVFYLLLLLIVLDRVIV